MSNYIPQIYLQTVRFSSVYVTSRTTWTFVEISDREGLTEVVEISCGEDTRAVASLIEEFVVSLDGAAILDESDVTEILGMGAYILKRHRIIATAVSALRTIVTSLQCRHKSMSIAQSLGQNIPESVPLYANINRSLLGNNRSPSDFARMAEKAVSQGFTTLKCAPFDEVNSVNGAVAGVEAATPGLQRIAAIRDAVGDRVNLLVDCHSRFGLDSAVHVGEALVKWNIGWYEEPVSPMNNPDELAQVGLKVPIPIAGGESGYGKELFDSLIKDETVSIVMPDIKFCGGAAEALRIMQSALDLGAKVSLHNPSGPVSQLGSAQVTAAITEGMPLEYAFGESEWRTNLMDPPERIDGGRFWLPDGHGLGAGLNQKLITDIGTRWEP